MRDKSKNKKLKTLGFVVSTNEQGFNGHELMIGLMAQVPTLKTVKFLKKRQDKFVMMNDARFQVAKIKILKSTAQIFQIGKIGQIALAFHSR